jgi:hypothetical protein
MTANVSSLRLNLLRQPLHTIFPNLALSSALSNFVATKLCAVNGPLGMGVLRTKENGQPKLTVIFAFEANCWMAASQERFSLTSL